jgi:ribosomal protein S18 acetylase RimI-like enzyme
MYMTTKRPSIRRWGLSFAFIGALFGGLAAYYCLCYEQGPIFMFRPSRDLGQMVELFEKNRTWLTYQKYSDPAFLFVNKTPSYRDARLMGRMDTKVYRLGDDLVGYVCYYKDLDDKGKILFLVVDEKYRGKRYAQELLQAAIDDFKKYGLTYAYLITRNDNIRAQKAYKRMGFFETERDDTYVTFGYKIV